MKEMKVKCKTGIHSRSRIVWMWMAGVSARDIALHNGLSLSTVYRWIRRWKNKVAVNTKASCSAIDTMCYVITALMLLAAVIGIEAHGNLLRPPRNNTLETMITCISSVLQSSRKTECFPIFLTDEVFHTTAIKDLDAIGMKTGFTMFKASVNITDTSNTMLLNKLIAKARQLRKLSWCVTVVVMSDDLDFLGAFAKWSLTGRLLVWSTRLLVVTFLSSETIKELLASYWTFSMTNAMLMNSDHSLHSDRYEIYVRLPYTPDGAVVLPVASCSNTNGLHGQSHHGLFPEKYSSFHGATINVTALPYAPYWMTAGEGTDARHSGIDHNQLVTVAEALNFNFRVLPSRNWKEVTDQVEARSSFIASIVYVVLPSRLERWDYTHYFDYSPLSFAMAKPKLRPQWQNFYHSLSTSVWIAILFSTAAICLTLVMVTRFAVWQDNHGVLKSGSVVLEMVGTLLGQGLFGRFSTRHSSHILIACWLFFGVVVGTAYRSSLIASITIPKYPTRPETLEELVNVIERATIESYGTSYKDFFTGSNYVVFTTFGRLMHVGVGVMEGLTDTLTKKRAHLGGLQYLQLLVAQYFTGIDGISSIYIGKESIIPATSAWPVPHDAPFKPQLDSKILAITEAGLYEKWRKDMLEDAERGSRMKQREELRRKQDQGIEGNVETEGSGVVAALTFIHIQGPLILLLVGLILGGGIFMAEFSVSLYSQV